MARKNVNANRGRAHEGGSGAHMTDLENQLHRQWAERHPRPAAAEDPCVVKRARVRSRLRAAGLLTPETSHELFKLTEAELDELLNA